MPDAKGRTPTPLRGGVGAETVLRVPKRQRQKTRGTGEGRLAGECRTPRCHRPAQGTDGRCEYCWAEAAAWWRWHGDRPLDIRTARALRELEREDEDES